VRENTPLGPMQSSPARWKDVPKKSRRRRSRAQQRAQFPAPSAPFPKPPASTKFPAAQGQSGGATLAGEGGLNANLLVVKGSRTRYSPQGHYGPLQNAHAALVEMYPNGLPSKKPDNLVQLTKAVNDWLHQQPGYDPLPNKTPDIDRATVRRAWAALLDRNK
jgi:hypothetical protein